MEFHPETLLPFAFSTQFADKYEESYALAGNDSTMEAYWADQAKLLDWYKKPETILDRSNAPFYSWFKGGIINASYNCIDRHAQKYPSRKALIYENSFGFPSAEYTYCELLDNVSRVAGVLTDHGVKKGDVVMIYMPNTCEATFTIFACARIGAIHYTVYAGLGVETIAQLINDSKPKLVVMSSFTMANKQVLDLKVIIDQALKKSNSIGIKKLIVQRDQYKVDLIKGEDFDFYKELSQAKPVDPVPLSSRDPLLLINTAGTTGVPKGLLYENAAFLIGAYSTAAKIMKISEGDVYISNSGLAWMVGVIANTYGCLLIGGTSILFEGDLTKTAELPWSLCEKHKVTSWMTYPSAVRTLKKMDPDATIMRKFDLSALRWIVYGGERMDTITEQWLADKVPQNCSIADAYGQTEAGMGFASDRKPLPGVRFAILDDNDQPMTINEPGRVCVKPPMSPGFAVALNNSKDILYNKYLAQSPGYYITGDIGYLYENGRLNIIGRADDVIVSMGRNVSASLVEEVIINHPDVAEIAVARGPHPITVEVPIAFIVLKKDVNRDIKKIENECVEKAIAEVGPWFNFFTTCIVIDELPKSRSGKVLRRVLKDILYHEEVRTPEALVNPHILDSLKKRVKDHNIEPEIDVNINAPVL